MTKRSTQRRRSRAQQIIGKIFEDRYRPGVSEFSFTREDLFAACQKLGIEPLKNMGDGPIYAFRYRSALPQAILDTQPEGLEWIITGAGIARYVLKLAKINRILPNPNLITVKIPNATPEIISAYALTDEQALLAKVRYNRLIDIFLGIACYSLQSHLRTTVDDIGQVEIDEIYVGLDRRGRQFVVPVQAKGRRDRLSAVQAMQDIAFCAERFPTLLCRAVSAQFMQDDLVAIFELRMEADEVRIVDERHYLLVAKDAVRSEN